MSKAIAATKYDFRNRSIDFGSIWAQDLAEAELEFAALHGFRGLKEMNEAENEGDPISATVELED